MTSWGEIAGALRFIASHWQDRKSSDGYMEVSFGKEGMVRVEIFAYGSMTMGRHHTIGPFNSEFQAQIETKALLSKECVELINSRQDEGQPIFEIPAILLG